MFIQGKISGDVYHGEFRSGRRQGEPFTALTVSDGISQASLMLPGHINFGPYDQVWAQLSCVRNNGNTFVNVHDWHIVEPNYDDLIAELKMLKKGEVPAPAGYMPEMHSID